MNDSYVELLVKKKKTTKDTVVKGALIAAIAVLVILGLAIPFVWIAALALGVFAYFKIPSLDVEWEYLYVNGELDVDKVMAKQRRKRVGSFDLDKTEIVAPWTSHELDYYKQGKLKTLDFTSGEENAKVYAMMTTVDKGKNPGPRLVLFEPNDEVIEDMRRLAPRKVKTY